MTPTPKLGAKAKVRTFDLECAYCGECLPSPGGSLWFSINEAVPPTIDCVSCGKTNCVPGKVPGTKFVIVTDPPTKV